MACVYICWYICSKEFHVLELHTIQRSDSRLGLNFLKWCYSSLWPVSVSLTCLSPPSCVLSELSSRDVQPWWCWCNNMDHSVLCGMKIYNTACNTINFTNVFTAFKDNHWYFNILYSSKNQQTRNFKYVSYFDFVNFNMTTNKISNHAIRIVKESKSWLWETVRIQFISVRNQ